ncbi:MAG: tellurite resistance TerB family protein [Myxococcales bacterium]|nr:tellurite resistance TerB family protein [Myxococcales bacterium]
MDATSLLGSMIGSNFGRGRGPSLGTVALGATGLAAAGGLGYLAYRHFQNRSPQASAPAGAPAGAPGGGFLAGVVGSTSGLRTDGFSVPGYEWQTGGGAMPGGPAPAPPPPAPTPQQQSQALLLVRAMVAAANADGQVDENERADILARLDAAGVGPEERAAFVSELDAPKPIALLAREVDSPELAEQVYVVSVLAVGAQSEAEKSHLRMLPSLLNLSPADVDAIHKKTGLPVIA